MANFIIKDGVEIIPQGVTKIEERAFKGYTDLTSIEIPDYYTVGEVTDDTAVSVN